MKQRPRRRIVIGEEHTIEELQAWNVRMTMLNFQCSVSRLLAEINKNIMMETGFDIPLHPIYHDLAKGVYYLSKMLDKYLYLIEEDFEE